MPPSISLHSCSPICAGAFLVPVFPGVGAGAERVAAPVAAQHRPGRHVDRRQPHRDRAHDQARRGLVAAAHQHRAVDRMAAQQFLAFHGEEVAVEHGRRFDERFGERHRRQLDRKAAGLPDAALDVFRAVAQMAVAGVDVAPGIEDADHRLAGPIVAVVAELLEPRAMAEGAQIVGAEPAVAAQSLRAICGRSCADCLRMRAASTGGHGDDGDEENGRGDGEDRHIDVPQPGFWADRRPERRIAVGVERPAADRAAG